ncbi:PREDICTED: uncharacterized protein LOC109234756 [Nicotiana attenuata]|uniref:uncharacterized protein LOC109234756 n=1 Tax=Nicotiana attenuata TaxID=49451 RepID=UPI000904DF22|nr:PREDICTED: uncharacterized protein LOC109234756 [Nicotiana attenuata]
MQRVRPGLSLLGAWRSRPIEPAASNGHWFIFVAIDYFTKWVEASSYKAVTKKVVADFLRDHIIKHQNSTTYRPQMNGAVEASNNNINKILRKIKENYKQWHKKLPFALIGYRATVRTSTGAIPYLLLHGTKAVIPAKVEIPSLRIIQEAELSDTEWVRNWYEQLALIDGERINATRHGQLYLNRLAIAFNKKVRSRQFTPRQWVLKRIFPHQDEAKGKFSPN